MARKTPNINALHTRRLAAVGVFTKAAEELLSTAAQYQDLADQAYAVARTQERLAAEAKESALSAEDQASRILGLLS